MDSSKEYILMCEKAEDIQKKFAKYEKTARETSVYNGDYITYDNEYGDLGNEHFVWVFRQDQLQEMVKGYSNGQEYITLTIEGKLTYFYRWVEKNITGYIANSMEQLWLAFVMKEKFNKKWTGNDWKKNNA